MPRRFFRCSPSLQTRFACFPLPPLFFSGCMRRASARVRLLLPAQVPHIRPSATHQHGATHTSVPHTSPSATHQPECHTHQPKCHTSARVSATHQHGCPTHTSVPHTSLSATHQPKCEPLLRSCIVCTLHDRISISPTIVSRSYS
jgi:hypothetical protein